MKKWAPAFKQGLDSASVTSKMATTSHLSYKLPLRVYYQDDPFKQALLKK